LIYVPCKVIFSIDVAKASDVPETATEVAEGIYVVVVTDVVTVLTPVRGIALSGMNSIGVSCSFSFNNLSNSASISFICAFYCMISFNNSSFSPSVSAISLACESSVAGNFSCFLRDAMSALFFLRNSSTWFYI
jgi:hypothetical protein